MIKLLLCSDIYVNNTSCVGFYFEFCDIILNCTTRIASP